MDEHSKITDRIFITDWYGSVDPDQLAKNNIKYILCLNHEFKKTEEDHEIYKIMQIHHKDIRIDDHPNACMYVHFPEIIEFMKYEKFGNVLVHCSAGISRSCTAVIAYLLYKVRITNPSIRYRILPYIVAFVKKRREWCNPNFGFLNQLHRFEDHLIKK